MRKLSARLKAIFDFVPEGCFPADIGADHALLTLALLESGKAKWAQAVENKSGPFIRMKSNIDASPYSSCVTCSKSDGLDELLEGVNCLILAGMGGRLSAEILQKGKSKLDHVSDIILDPHTDLTFVRSEVVGLGFYVAEEMMVYEEKIFYSIIHFRKGAPERPYTKLELALGPSLMQKRDPVFLQFVLEQEKKVGKILDKCLPAEARRKYLNFYRALKAVYEGGQSLSK